MKRLVVILGCVIALQVASTQSSFARGSFGVSFSIFYDGLSPHGDWISVGGGVYGWRPVGISAGWRPYTIGRWCWTDDGWYWTSEEPWSWAAYHYGRWTYDDYYGWIWIPGYDWAPAWVEWRYGGDYVGWAPLSPYAVFSASWGIHYRTRWYTPHHWWNFVGCANIASPNVHRYVYRSEDNTRYIGVTRSGGSVRREGGRIVTRGPEREYIERRGNVRVEPVKIRDVEDRASERVVREGSREQIEVYRPRIEEGRGDNANLGRPSRIREDAGRTLDIDTRKIDVRAREVQREEGRDLKRSDEIRARGQSGRSAEDNRDVQARRDEGMLKGPVDDATRKSEATSRNRVQPQDQPQERQRDDARNIERPRERGVEGRSRGPQPEVRPEGKPEQRTQPSPEPRERRREETRLERPQQPRMEMPRNEAPRNSGGSGRPEGGRSGRGR